MTTKNKKPQSKNEGFVEKILLTVLGGLGLFVATAILNSMFSAPVSRADFDVHRAETTRHLKNIDAKLHTLKDGQSRLIDHLLNKDGKK